jgi:hypothetical protein
VPRMAPCAHERRSQRGNMPVRRASRDQERIETGWKQARVTCRDRDAHGRLNGKTRAMSVGGVFTSAQSRALAPRRPCPDIRSMEQVGTASLTASRMGDAGSARGGMGRHGASAAGRGHGRCRCAGSAPAARESRRDCERGAGALWLAASAQRGAVLQHGSPARLRRSPRLAAARRAGQRRRAPPLRSWTGLDLGVACRFSACGGAGARRSTARDPRMQARRRRGCRARCGRCCSRLRAPRPCRGA